MNSLGSFNKILAIGEESALWLEIMLKQKEDIDFYHAKDFDNYTNLHSEEIFDLIICLNFIGGKHKSYDFKTINTLCKAANFIVFSSPSPIRAGTYQVKHWPSYWVDIFNNLEFFTSTYGRSILWENKLVNPHIIQELLICSGESNITKSDIPFDVIHPESISQLSFENRKNRLLNIPNRLIFKITPYFLIRMASAILPLKFKKSIKTRFLT